MINFIWPYSKTHEHYDELRWSVRSVNMFCKDEHRITIVGDKPGWYSGTHISHKRITNRNDFTSSLTDALTKFYTGLQVSSEETCVWMMDDCFFIKPFTVEELAIPRAEGRMNHSDVNGFRRARTRTKMLLEENGLPTYDFATHLPHVVNRKTAIELFKNVGFIENNLLWEVYYENYMLQGKPVRPGDFGTWIPLPLSDAGLQLTLQGKTCFSTSQKSWNESVRRFLYHHVTEKSEWEINDPIPPRNTKSEGRYTPWGDGWTSPNGKSPEYEFLTFLKGVVTNTQPKIIIETGMGQGFVTREISRAKNKDANFYVYESNPKFRLKPINCKVQPQPDPTPPPEIMASADLVILDSHVPIRMEEITLWAEIGKVGSTMIVHDVSDRHGPNKIHTQLLKHIDSLGLNGSLLRNPRGGFITSKRYE